MALPMATDKNEVVGRNMGAYGLKAWIRMKIAFGRFRQLRPHHQNHKPQNRNADGLRSFATLGPRTCPRPSSGMDRFEADPWLRIERSRWRNSHRGAKTFNRDGQPRRDSCLHFRRELGQVRRTGVGPYQHSPRTERGRRSGQTEPGNHRGRALIASELLRNSLPADDTGITQS
jgi:hypothetical protein